MPIIIGDSTNQFWNFSNSSSSYTINGGSGNDSIVGGISADRIDGGVGNDVLRGNDGNDSLSGGAGNDTLYGGTGIDRMHGGAGNDQFLIFKGDLAWDSMPGIGGDTIYDFQGAGQANTAGVDNDFIRLIGFDKDTATLTLLGRSSAQLGLQYYEISDKDGSWILSIKIAPGENLAAELGKMDYIFA